MAPSQDLHFGASRVKADTVECDLDTVDSVLM